jgi:hypothetical protein
LRGNYVINPRGQPQYANPNANQEVEQLAGDLRSHLNNYHDIRRHLKNRHNSRHVEEILHHQQYKEARGNPEEVFELIQLANSATPPISPGTPLGPPSATSLDQPMVLLLHQPLAMPSSLMKSMVREHSPQSYGLYSGPLTSRSLVSSSTLVTPTRAMAHELCRLVAATPMSWQITCPLCLSPP